MNRRRLGGHAIPTKTLIAALFLVVPGSAQARQTEASPSSTAAASWPQWGGPDRNFMVAAPDLAHDWPATGPPRLWSRELGEGYSAIAADGGVLYTQYRLGDSERVIALSAADGHTVWEHAYASPTAGWRFDRGAGPHATPALSANRVFAAGATGILTALERADGKVAWSHDLVREHQASELRRGYSSSPLLYRDLVIVPVGGEGKTLIAFRQSDGTVVWRGGDDDASYSSPILIQLDGEDQVVMAASNLILGLDPDDGQMLWSHPHPTRGAFNISTPVFADDGLLFVSSAYDGGGRVLRLSRDGSATRAEEVWFSNQVRVHFGTAIRLGDTVYASSGDFGPAPMAAVDVKTGAVRWRDRTFAKHSLVHAGDELILLDEDGVLALVTVSEEGLSVRARTQLFDGLSWTVPTLVGTRLYARNRERLVALELAG